MTYKNIFNLIIEGPDGVGKSTLISGIFEKTNFRYMCYHRGELSNLVYARKYNRPFFATQRGLPFLYIYLDCDEAELVKRLESRDYASQEEHDHELAKVKDAKLFRQAAKDMLEDYDIMYIDTTDRTIEQTLSTVLSYLNARFSGIPGDDNLTSWNQMYDKACLQLNKKFKVIDNQPYIDDVPMMVESTCHNGTYEKFDDKRYPDNLIYAYAYNERNICKDKKYDFNYIINSKILRRNEIYQYYSYFENARLSCIVSDNNLIPHYVGFERVGRRFGKDYLDTIAESAATVYAARDLAYLELQTARLYEAIIANNVVFVDRQSDPQCKILHAIHGCDSEVIDLLYVTPEDICNKYNYIIRHQYLWDKILKRQHDYLDNLFDKLERGEL